MAASNPGKFVKPSVSSAGKVSIGKNKKSSKKNSGKIQKVTALIPKGAEDDKTFDPDDMVKCKQEFKQDKVNVDSVVSLRDDESNDVYCERKWYISTPNSAGVKNIGSEDDPEYKYLQYMFKVTDVSIDTRVRMIQHPVENGTVRHDNKVRDPIKGTVQGWVRGSDAEYVNEMLDAIINETGVKGSLIYVAGLLTTSSPSIDFNNGISNGTYGLLSYTRKANKDKYDVFDYTLNLQEIMIAKDSTTVQDTSNADTTDKGSKGAA